MLDDARLSFRQGVLVGVGASLVGVYAWVLGQMSSLLDMYKDFGGASLPRGTIYVLTSRWLWAVPIVGAGVVGWLIAKRPRSIVPYAAVVIAFSAALIATRYFAYLPITELAGNIRD